MWQIKTLQFHLLCGFTAEEASSRLESLGLPARIDLVDSEQPDGTVISQAFAPGEKLEKGKIVNIRVSRAERSCRSQMSEV